MKEKLKRSVTGILALSLLLGCLSGCGGNTATTMRLKKYQGTVGVEDAKDARLEAREGMQLYSGYEVGTADESRAWIDLDEYKAVKLEQLSTGEILKDGKHLTLKLHEGKLFFNVTKPLEEDETLNIQAATMVTGIRGTSGWVEVIDEYTVQLALLEGTVEAASTDPTTHKSRQTTVTGGQIITVVYYGTGEKPQAEDETINDLIGDGTITEDHIIHAEEGLRVEELQEERVPEFVADEVAASEDLQDKIEEKSQLSIPKILNNQTPPQERTPATEESQAEPQEEAPQEPEAEEESQPQDEEEESQSAAPEEEDTQDTSASSPTQKEDDVDRVYYELEDGTKVVEEYRPDGSVVVIYTYPDGTQDVVLASPPIPDPPPDDVPDIPPEFAWEDPDTGDVYYQRELADGTVIVEHHAPDGSITTTVTAPNGDVSQNYQPPPDTDTATPDSGTADSPNGGDTPADDGTSGESSAPVLPDVPEGEEKEPESSGSSSDNSDITINNGGTVDRNESETNAPVGSPSDSVSSENSGTSQDSSDPADSASSENSGASQDSSNPAGSASSENSGASQGSSDPADSSTATP